jgi:hypothetical protein
VTTAFVADERPTSSSAGAGTMFSAVLADAISCKGKTGMIG